jgi:choline-sulfatase
MKSYRIAKMIIILLVFQCSFVSTSSSWFFDNDTNVILFTLDTTQAKTLGVYGNRKDISPNLDNLAKESIVFDNSFVMCNITGPSHASILSSKYVSEHGVIENYNILIDSHITLLPEIMRQNGYTTFASVSCGILNPENCGLGKGFDVFSRCYDEKFKNSTPEEIHTATGVTDSFMEWFKNKKKGKFFAWLHYMDPHMDYTPPRDFNKYTNEKPVSFWKKTKDKNILCKNLTEEQLDTGRALYNGEVSYMDYEVGRVIDFLKRKNIYDDTLIVITNDHGENIAEHEPFYFAHTTLYDVVMKEVLIVKFPGNKKYIGRCDALTAAIDIAPTILDYIRIDIPDFFSGHSLLPIVKKKKNSVRDFLVCEFGGNKGYLVVSGNDRYFEYYDVTEEQNGFYDIKNDPNEMKNLFSSGDPSMKKYQTIVKDWRNKGFYKASIEDPYVGDVAFYHDKFFYLQANFSREKKKATFEFGEKLKGKYFVLNLAESGLDSSKIYNIKDNFLQPENEKDVKFKLSSDYSVKAINKDKKVLRLYSKKIPIKYEHTWKLGYDFYTYSVDIYIKDPQVKVKLHFLSWLVDDKNFWLKGKTFRDEKIVKDKGKWVHVNYVQHFTDKFKAIGMVIDIIGNSTVWIDNARVGKILNPYPANPWNDPDLKDEVMNNPDLLIMSKGKKVDSLPYKVKLQEPIGSSPLDTVKNRVIFIDEDENNIYLTLEGYPDESLRIELGGYVGDVGEDFKKAEEGKGLSKDDIDNLKALGYIQ